MCSSVYNCESSSSLGGCLYMVFEAFGLKPSAKATLRSLSVALFCASGAENRNKINVKDIYFN